jgi:hypothetical protein
MDGVDDDDEGRKDSGCPIHSLLLDCFSAFSYLWFLSFSYDRFFVYTVDTHLTFLAVSLLLIRFKEAVHTFGITFT